jgi:hypothetical protein
MRVDTFRTKVENINRRVLATNEWKKRVYLCKHDAAKELSKIYFNLTGEVPDEDVELAYGLWVHKFWFGSQSHGYIYQLDNVSNARCPIQYGKDQLEYPVEDETLWPWTLKELPVVPKDIWRMITRYLSPNDMITLGQVCLLSYHVINENATWLHYKDMLVQHVHCSRALFNNAPRWKDVFLKLRMYSPRYHLYDEDVPYFKFVLNSFLPFEQAVITDNWRSPICSNVRDYVAISVNETSFVWMLRIGRETTFTIMWSHIGYWNTKISKLDLIAFIRNFMNAKDMIQNMKSTSPLRLAGIYTDMLL